MTRRRAQPRGSKPKGRPSRRPRFAGRALASFGGLLARHPSLAGGVSAFAVIFAFVSANALWYQPGGHPAPLFKTRQEKQAAGDWPTAKTTAAETAIRSVTTPEPRPDALTVDGLLAGLPEPRKVTTVAIRPPDDGATASIPTTPAAGPADRLTADLQRELARRGLYDGAIDGLMGPRTKAAIAAYQRAIGEAATGAASASLLAAMRIGGIEAVVTPKTRPAAQPGVPSAGADAPRPDVAIGATVPAAQPSDLVAQIQTGLSNLAYQGMRVDGIAGPRTRAAIRDFERHYRLPETGEPSERVLSKLREIGAL